MDLVVCFYYGLGDFETDARFANRLFHSRYCAILVRVEVNARNTDLPFRFCFGRYVSSPFFPLRVFISQISTSLTVKSSNLLPLRTSMPKNPNIWTENHHQHRKIVFLVAYVLWKPHTWRMVPGRARSWCVGTTFPTTVSQSSPQFQPLN
jgi:hypothetical protein